MIMGAPGFRTLRDSDSPAFLSYQSLKEKSEQMASKDPSSNGSSSAVDSTNSAGESPRSALAELTLFSAVESISGIGSTQTRSLPTTSSAKLPGPQPISRTLP